MEQPSVNKTNQSLANPEGELTKRDHVPSYNKIHCGEQE